MSKIRIFSKKAFAIGPGAIRNTDIIDSFVTVPGTFQSVDEAYMNDPTFKAAVKANEIEIVNASNQKTLENNDSPVKTDDKSSESEIEEYYNILKVMNKDDAVKEASKYDVKLDGNERLKDIKKKVFEAFKLTKEDEEFSDSDTGSDTE